MEEQIDDQDECLPEVTMTPELFRHAARRAGWQQKTIDLFLVGRPIKERITIGEKPTRVLALVKW